MKLALAFVVLMFIASASLGDDTSPAGNGGTSSNDPVVLKGIIRDQEHQIAQLNAEVAKLRASTATTRPANKFPSIAGVWIEDNAQITVTQSNGDFKADCSYKSNNAEIRWIMHGTITQQGKIEGSLQHIRAPKGWVLTQSREGQLSDDGTELVGIATFSNAPHPFTWKRKEAVDAEVAKEKAEFDALPQEIKAAFSEHTLAVGMTLAQCDKSLGATGSLTGADTSQKNYQWYQLVGHDNLGNPQASIQYTGVVVDGKLTSFEKHNAEPFDAGSAATFQGGGRP